jgi:peptide/nickel transport system substrate-binding protein
MNRFGPRGVALALLACLLAAGCGGATPTRRDSRRQVVTLLMARAPDSLDPAVGDNAEALEADWLVYTPLLTYLHSGGTPGTQVISGLASALPTISEGGRLYTFTLRPGLVYSNGQPVRASDFTRAVERAIKLGWGGAHQFLIGRIAGAAAFARGRARTISGITTNDSAGQITIRLTAPYGRFENVLALPAMAPVPPGTPMRDEPSHPPPGIGPYTFASILPGRSFSVVRNPAWHRGEIPGIPAGHVDVTVTVTGNVKRDATSVLANRADVFDWADQIPASLLPRIHQYASARYSKQPIDASYAIFMNVNRRPFSSQLVRAAVQTGLDENTLKQLGLDTLQEGCFLVPPSMYGHPHDQCPRGNIEAGGSPAAAKSLVERSGLAGTRITVWGPADPPFSSWMAYYTSLLNQIGFRARLKLVSNASYYAAIGDERLHPQTGFGALKAEVPDPVALYQWLSSSAIQPQGNRNWGEIHDSHLDQQVRILGVVPASNLSAVAGFWHALERYVAARAYLAVFGYQTVPQFVSDRLVYSAIVLSPVAGLDWSSFRLK